MAAVVLMLVIIEDFGTGTYLLLMTVPHPPQTPGVRRLLSSKRPVFELGLQRQKAVVKVRTSFHQT